MNSNFFLIAILLGCIGLFPIAFADDVPDWVKNTAGWWANDAISEKEFLNAIEFLVKDGIISVKNDSNVQENIETYFNETVHTIPDEQFSPIINSHGFRGNEIIKEKPDDTFRIFTVGGSTTFSVGVDDESTWPNRLETKIHNLVPNQNVEVINAGISSATSYVNSDLIKEKLIHFKPDLIIIYEGVNEQGCMMESFDNKNTQFSKEAIAKKCGVNAYQDYPISLAERYSDLCDFGQMNNFELIIAFQPTVKFDGKILTNEELSSYFDRPQYPIILENYGKMVKETLSQIKNCDTTADFTKIFDEYDIPLYFDYHHLGNNGNIIISEKMLELVLPILIDNDVLANKHYTSDSINTKKLFPNIDQRNSDFSNKILNNKDFFGTNLDGSNFSNTKLTNIDFRLANLENVNFAGSQFIDVKFRQNIMTGADFSNTSLQGAVLSGKDLRKTFFHNTNLRNSDLSGTDLSVSFLKNVDLRGANFYKAILNDIEFDLIINKSLENTIIDQTYISFANLNEITFPKKIETTNFQLSELQNADMSNSEIRSSYFGDSIMIGVNLENSNLNTRQYEYYLPYTPELASLSDSELVKEITELPIIIILEKEILDGFIKLQTANFNNFEYADLSNANMKNTQLIVADFIGANLTGANLSGANLT